MKQKRKVYIAKRIPKDSAPAEVLPITPAMTLAEVSQLYRSHFIDRDTYIYNGHWTLRGNTPVNNIPSAITPEDIWNMCKSKLDDSDAVVAVVGLDTYGTIAEAAYVIGLDSKPLYVLPESNDPQLLKEAWFIFAMSQSTKEFWSEEDIKNVPVFMEHGINDLTAYRTLLDGLVPPFLKQ